MTNTSINSTTGRQEGWVARQGLVLENLCIDTGNGQRVLVNARLPATGMLALAGPCTSTTTALVHLLAGRSAVESGCISIAADTCTASPLHRPVVAQLHAQPCLQQDTIFNNIAQPAMQASAMEVLEAADKARVLDFAWELHSGIHTRVDTENCTLSVSQQQRILVARFLLQQTPVLLVDEAVLQAALHDNELLQALHALAEQAAVLVHAQHTTTLQYVHQVLFLQDNGAVRLGTHQQLLDEEPAYLRFWHTL
jgi:ATP-binding cassette subfamily B protein